MTKFAGTLAVRDGMILLVQEAHTEAYGLWSFPLGHVDLNESIEEAAVRETKEETGFVVSLGKSKQISVPGKDFKSLSRFDTELINLTIFEAKIESGEIAKGKDVLAAKWFPLEEVKHLPLRGEWVRYFLGL